MADPSAPRRSITRRGIAKALREYQGNQAAVARAFGVNRSAICKRIKKCPKLQAVSTEAKETMKDHAESSLQRAILAGEAWAVCFYLKTQARDRGYIERAEHVHGGDPANPILHQHTVTAQERRERVLGVLERAKARAALPTPREALETPGEN